MSAKTWRGRGNCSLKIKGDEIMSLKEKAKTSYSICQEAALTCEKCEPQNKCGSGNCPLVNVLWIRLEQILADLKEKLEEKAEILCYQCEKCGFIDVTSKEEFEKLPKEQQQFLLRHRQECGGRFIPVKYVLLKDIEEMLKEVVEK